MYEQYDMNDLAKTFLVLALFYTDEQGYRMGGEVPFFLSSRQRAFTTRTSDPVPHGGKCYRKLLF